MKFHWVRCYSTKYGKEEAEFGDAMWEALYKDDGELIREGDYYHDKISARLQGILLCAKKVFGETVDVFDYVSLVAEEDSWDGAPDKFSEVKGIEPRPESKIYYD